MSTATAWAERHPELTPILLIATDGQLSDFDTAFAALGDLPCPSLIVSLGGPLPTEWATAGQPTRTTELSGPLDHGDVASLIRTGVEAR